jgi:glycerol uptake facilitator-like aquaporin
VTVGRIFSDTFAGIAPASVPGFVVAQLVGTAVGLGLLLILFPSAARTADVAVLPRSSQTARS